jgi:hypothetical protein
VEGSMKLNVYGLYLFEMTLQISETEEDGLEQKLLCRDGGQLCNELRFIDLARMAHRPEASVTPLESHLKALRICHPLALATALMYHHPRGRPLNLGPAWLTKKWCHHQIQTRGEGGHDPEEATRACVDLLRFKIQTNGAGFGEFKTDNESIFECMARVWAVSACRSCGWVGIDRLCLDEVDGESDGGCTGES